MKKMIIAFLVGSIALASCNGSGSGASNNGKDSTNKANTTTAAGTPGQPGQPGQPNTGQPGQPAATPVPAGPATTVKFESDNFDFGKIKQGETVEHIFKFTNTGTHDLVISEAHGSCGCTVPYYPHEPIAAGASGEIKVSFNSAGKSGAQSKTVTLTANTDPAQTVLTIKSDVQVPAGGAAGATGH